MKTDRLIDVLAEDTGPVAGAGRAIGLAALAGFATAALVFVALIGPRSDIAQAAESVRFLFKFVAAASLAGAAVVVAIRQARPDTSRWESVWPLMIAPALLGAAVILELLVTPQKSWGPRLVGTNSLHCLTLIPLLAVGPLAWMLASLRRGAARRPGLAGAVAGLAASGIAAALYAANCPDDSPLFVATWYALATAIVVTAGALIGPRVLRW